MISCLGLMYLPDQPRALAGMHRALRPRGRVAAIVFSPVGAENDVTASDQRLRNQPTPAAA